MGPPADIELPGPPPGWAPDEPEVVKVRPKQESDDDIPPNLPV